MGESFLKIVPLGLSPDHFSKTLWGMGPSSSSFKSFPGDPNGRPWLKTLIEAEGPALRDQPRGAGGAGREVCYCRKEDKASGRKVGSRLALGALFRPWQVPSTVDLGSPLHRIRH